MKKIKYFTLFGIIALGISGCSCSPRTNPEPVTLSKISLSGNYKTEFLSNENFTYEGLVVTASYSDSHTKEVTNYTVSTPDMTIYTPQTVTVSYTEETITKTAEYTINVTNVTDIPTLIENSLRDLRSFFNDLDMENYSRPRWNKMVDLFNQAVANIKLASTYEQIENLKNEAITALRNSPTSAQITEGTYFGVKNSDVYEYDRDDDNNLVISYNGYPGHWKHVGANDLKVNLEKENYFTVTIHNDIAEQIEVCLQLMKNSDKVADSGIKKIAGNSQLEIRLDFDTEITKLYLFLDSCSEHNRVGQVTIKEAKFGYESHEITTVFDPVTININKAFDKDTNHAKYTLTADEHPRYIRRVDVMGKVDYHGNANNKQYFGITVSAGSSSVTLNDAAVHTQTNDTGINFIANLVIESSNKLSTGAEVSTKVSYCAEGLTFEVTKYIFYYTLWNPTTFETVEVNQYIYQGGAANEIAIPYSSFTKTGRVDHIDVEFSYVNPATYAKSQVYFKGYNFTNFSGGNNNVLNIGSFMGKSSDGVTPATGTGTARLYPTKDIDLKTSANITITCWWSCATDIKVNSITAYTDVEEIPEAVSGLEAHPIDSGVVLNWNAVGSATSYEVYKNGTLLDTVRSTFITIDSLTNGTEYTFGVKSKNSVGTSDMVTIKATPVEGATYDTFIENLNTPLEVKIGQEGINNVLEASCQYREFANNARLKNAIEKLKRGEDTTVVFCGGSITVGEGSTLKDEKHHPMGYAYYTYQWLKNTYDTHNKLRYINASISGTGSHIGIVRAEKDIMQYNPDLVFIEFAANNNTTEFNNATYESLIRKCQALPNDPAIILVFSVTYYTGHTEQVMSAIGKHYDLPMYTIDKGLRTVCTPDQKRQDPIYHDYSADGTHPSDDGHQLMAKGLCYFMRGLLNEEADVKNTYSTEPSQSGYDAYDTLISVDHNSNNSCVKSLGSFAAANTATNCTKNQSDVTAFQQGWKKTTTDSNEPMVIEMNAKNFILIYEAGNPDVAGDPEGIIVVTYKNLANESETETLTWDLSRVARQGNSGSTAITDQDGHGWNNPVGILIFNKAVAANYQVTIKMENNSGICSIMAFGYSI